MLRSRPMPRLAFVLVLAALVAAPPFSRAVEVERLYWAETIVTGTEEPERSRGFRAGLAEVFVKLTGDIAVAESRRLHPVLDRAPAFVARFEYEDRMKGIPVHDEQGTRERPHFLRIWFDEAAVDAALAELGLLKWPADRPRVLVWLTVRDAVHDYLLTAAGESGYGQRAVLVETAWRRGLPIALPEGPEDAGGDDAFARWRAERGEGQGPLAVLRGRLTLAERGYWNMEWKLDWRGRDHAWRLERVTFDVAIRNGLGRAAGLLSATR